jgi:putative transposase
MDERVRFVARLLDGEKMAPLCRSFGISRKTGYKIFERYKTMGLEGLTDRSRRPYRQANQLPFQLETLIVSLKKEQPSWGAPKIREKLIRLYPEVHTPAVSTVHAALDRHGLVKRRKRRRHKATGTGLSRPRQPNDLWCADYKGEFMLADRRYCYPLTITDHESRYLLACEALSSTKERFAFPVFERVFKEFGMPLAIRTDNGVPFASPNALYGLSRLSVWWLRLGISIERIKPGNPQQNGRHERMHLTLKKETTKPAGDNFLQQQGRFDAFIDYFNTERPHQGLDMKLPAECHVPSPRVWACPRSTTRSTTKPLPSRPAGASVSGERKSISQPSLQATSSASSRSTTSYGSQASCPTTLDTSMKTPAGSSRSLTRSAKMCYLCLGNNL